jgi:hypothetical protein
VRRGVLYRAHISLSEASRYYESFDGLGNPAGVELALAIQVDGKEDLSAIRREIAGNLGRAMEDIFAAEGLSAFPGPEIGPV